MATEEDDKIISIKSGTRSDRSYETTMISNSRRYSPVGCPHKGPYIIDNKLATVECQDCGSLLNPIFVLEKLAYKEAYWNQRQKDLNKYIADLEKEIDGRVRTRCTHCNNMTAIRFKAKMPRTWIAQPYS